MSAEYREETHRRWERELPHIKSLDVAGGVFTMVITTCGFILAGTLAWGLLGG